MALPTPSVVAWILSMMMVASGIPMGYEYPAPEVPFIEGAPVSTTPAPDCVPVDLQDSPYYASLLEMGIPLCTTLEYDDYDPNDIPEDQAKPEEVTEGYNYPVPENPLVLPTKPTTAPAPILPDCIPAGEETLGENAVFLEQGVLLCPEELPAYTEAPALEYDEYDEYDPNDIPEDQAKPQEVTEGYNYPVPENPLTLPTKPTTTPAPIILPDCIPAGDEDLGDNQNFLDQGVPLCPEEQPAYTEAPAIYDEYDEYDPNDIPEDQAKPVEVTEGYNYPVPENPLVLPTKPTTTPAPVALPECVPTGEEDIGENPSFLDQGVPLCPEELPAYTEAPAIYDEYDEYDPSDIPEDQTKPEEELSTYTDPPPLPLCVTEDDPMLETYQELGVEICPVEDPVLEYDEYDPNDIPEDQAKPEEVTEGYNFPVPENPLVLPAKPTTTPAPVALPDCVQAGEEDIGDNPSFLDQGVPLCPEELPAYTEAPAIYDEYDEYDPNDIPEDQAKPEEVTEGYNYPVPENPLTLPTKPTTTLAPLPDCVAESDDGAAEFIAQGVPLCPEQLPAYTETPVVDYDEYDPNDIPADQAAPVTEGYNYPVPENPLVLPAPEELPAYTEPPVVDYDEYDPNDIPADQAAPEGYSYPVPENPLELPGRARKAKLGFEDPTEEEDLTIGLSHLDMDSYDPGNYDHNSPDYIEEVEEARSSTPDVLQTKKTQASESGVSLTGPGHVISFHVPAGHVNMLDRPREDFGAERHADPFSRLLGGELLPPVLRKMKKGGEKMEALNRVEVERHASPSNKVNKRLNKNKRFKNRNRGNKNKRIKSHGRNDKSVTTQRPTPTPRSTPRPRPRPTPRSTPRPRTTPQTTSRRPRGGRRLRTGRRLTTRGRQNASVRAWLARG